MAGVQQYQSLIVYLASQFVVTLIWGVMMEMRMRNAESACKEFWQVRDDVRDMKRDLDTITGELKELNGSLAWMKKPPGYEFEPMSRTPR